MQPKRVMAQLAIYLHEERFCLNAAVLPPLFRDGDVVPRLLNNSIQHRIVRRNPNFQFSIFNCPLPHKHIISPASFQYLHIRFREYVTIVCCHIYVIFMPFFIHFMQYIPVKFAYFPHKHCISIDMLHIYWYTYFKSISIYLLFFQEEFCL